MTSIDMRTALLPCSPPTTFVIFSVGIIAPSMSTRVYRFPISFRPLSTLSGYKDRTFCSPLLTFLSLFLPLLIFLIITETRVLQFGDPLGPSSSTTFFVIVVRMIEARKKAKGCSGLLPPSRRTRHYRHIQKENEPKICKIQSFQN